MNVQSFVKWYATKRLQMKNAVIVQSLQTYPTQKRSNIQYIEKYDNSIFYDVIRVIIICVKGNN